MRIPIDLLPPIESLPGSFRTMDCFTCVWCIFTDCSVEQRAEMIAATKNGVNDHKIVRLLNKLYPEHMWSWGDYHGGGIPSDLYPGQAALIIYEVRNHIFHYAILMNRGGVYERYDPQSLKIYPFDCLTENYSILNAYIPRSGGEIFEGKLSPRRLKYQSLSNHPTVQSEQHQIYYKMLYYLKRARKLFTDQDLMEDDIAELREIGEFINKINEMRMEGRDQLVARRVLNDIYAYHYKSLLGWRPEDLVALDRKIKLKTTNYMSSVKSQKPTKSKFTKSKRNSASVRKSKRRRMRPSTWREHTPPSSRSPPRNRAASRSRSHAPSRRYTRSSSRPTETIQNSSSSSSSSSSRTNTVNRFRNMYGY